MVKTLLTFLLITFSAVAETPDPVFEELKKELKGQRDTVIRKVRRTQSDQTLHLECFITSDGDLKMLSEIARDISKYKTWALENINTKADGSKYLVQFMDMVWKAPKSLQVFFSLEIPSPIPNTPLFKQSGNRTFDLTFADSKESFHMIGSSLYHEDDPYLGEIQAELKAYREPKTKDRVWAYFKASAKIKWKIIFEAFPEKILSREGGDRVQKFVHNYVKEEDRVAADKGKR